MSPLRWLLIVLLTGSMLSCGGLASKSPTSSTPPGNNDSSGTNALFFGMQMNTGVLNHQPWPTAQFGTVRLWIQIPPGARSVRHREYMIGRFLIIGLRRHSRTVSTI
jgi:hypothetical protein